MKRGAKVFRNVAPSGNTDIVFLKDDKLLRVDVKHLKYVPGKAIWCANNAAVPPANVAFVYVNPATWEIRWSRRGANIPKGWEDFWE